MAMNTRGKSFALKRRRRERGAAMVEALVAIPFFILVFGFTMFLGTFYGEKMRTLRVSRECAWSNAMLGCNGGCQASVGVTDGEQLTPPDAQDPAANGAPGSEIMSKDWYQATFTVKSSATASGVIGGFSKPLESTTRVMCNEEPENGDLAGVVGYIWNNAKGF